VDFDATIEHLTAHVDRPVRHFDDVGRRTFGVRLGPREAQELADELRGARRRFLGLRQELLFVGLGSREHDGQARHDDGEHVVEVVRDARRELPDGLHLVRLPQLLLRLANRRDVGGDEGERHDAIVFEDRTDAREVVGRLAVRPHRDRRVRFGVPRSSHLRDASAHDLVVLGGSEIGCALADDVLHAEAGRQAIEEENLALGRDPTEKIGSALEDRGQETLTRAKHAIFALELLQAPFDVGG
jgi:hypothetical protein